MKTTSGLEQVHVIYRRIDDDYMDPLIFRADSAPRRSRDYRRLSQRQCGACKCSRQWVADDKAVYAYVPDMIKYYLNEEPILPECSTS